MPSSPTFILLLPGLLLFLLVHVPKEANAAKATTTAKPSGHGNGTANATGITGGSSLPEGIKPKPKSQTMHVLQDALLTFLDVLDNNDDGEMSKKEVDGFMEEVEKMANPSNDSDDGEYPKGVQLIWRNTVSWYPSIPLVIDLAQAVKQAAQNALDWYAYAANKGLSTPAEGVTPHSVAPQLCVTEAYGKVCTGAPACAGKKCLGNGTCTEDKIGIMAEGEKGWVCVEGEEYHSRNITESSGREVCIKGRITAYEGNTRVCGEDANKKPVCAEAGQGYACEINTEMVDYGMSHLVLLCDKNHDRAVTRQEVVELIGHVKEKGHKNDHEVILRKLRGAMDHIKLGLQSVYDESKKKAAASLNAVELADAGPQENTEGA